MSLLKTEEEVKLAQFDSWIHDQIDNAESISKVCHNGDEFTQLKKRWEKVLDDIALAMALSNRTRAWYSE